MVPKSGLDRDRDGVTWTENDKMPVETIILSRLHIPHQLPLNLRTHEALICVAVRLLIRSSTVNLLQLLGNLQKPITSDPLQTDRGRT